MLKKKKKLIHISIPNEYLLRHLTFVCLKEYYSSFVYTDSNSGFAHYE